MTTFIPGDPGWWVQLLNGWLGVVVLTRLMWVEPSEKP